MNWGRIIPWILVVLLAAILILDLRGCKRGGAVDGSIQDSLLVWKNKAGQLIVSLKNAQDSFAMASKPYRDSIAALLNSKDKLVQEVIDLKLHGKTTIYVDTGKDKMVVVYKDTGHTQVASVSQYFSNPYYQVVADLNLEHPALSNVQVQTFDSLLLAWKFVKTGGLFNRHTYLELDVKNANPYSTVTGLKAYRVPPVPQKHWGIGPFIGWGYGFNATGPQWGYPVVGVAIQYSIIKF